MNALLWKDLRLNRAILGLSCVLLLLPHAGGALFMAWDSSQRGAGWWSWAWSYDTVMRMSFISLILSFIGLTILAGNTVACEREDGSDEFLAVLPPSPWVVLASKVLVVMGAVLVLWGPNVIGILGIAPRLPGAPRVLVPGVDDNPATELLYLASAAVLMVGAAWWMGSFVRKASTAWALAIPTPLAVAGILLLAQASSLLDRGHFGTAFLVLSVTLGVAGGIKGSLNFVRGPEV